MAGIHYLPAGQFQGDLVYASYFDKEVWRVLIDDATGLPIGGANTPSEERIAFGFAGLRLTPEGPTIEPRLPRSWRALRFAIQLRGKSWIVEHPGRPIAAPSMEQNP